MEILNPPMEIPWIVRVQELTMMPDDLVLAVFDEGHEIFRTNQRLFQEVRAQHKLILSDLSQSFLLGQQLS